MENTSIGNEIKNLRTSYKVPQKNLAEGLCSISTLSRIEYGERSGDSLLISALLQRLGRSPDLYENFFEQADYQLLLLREAINEALAIHNLTHAKALIDTYKKCHPRSDRLNQQYMLLVQSEIACMEKKEPSHIIALAENALQITMPKIKAISKDILHTRLLNDIELELLCNYFSNISFTRNKSESRFMELKEILIYIENHRIMSKEMDRVYIKAAVALVDQYYQCGLYEKGIAVCDEISNKTRHMDMILYFAELKYQKVKCMEKLIGIHDGIDQKICKELYLQVYHAFQFLGDRRSEEIMINRILRTADRQQEQDRRNSNGIL